MFHIKLQDPAGKSMMSLPAGRKVTTNISDHNTTDQKEDIKEAVEFEARITATPSYPES